MVLPVTLRRQNGRRVRPASASTRLARFCHPPGLVADEPAGCGIRNVRHRGELVDETRQSHRPVTISEHGQPVAALISIDDLADLEDRAALAAHLADKAAGHGGISLDGLDAALDRIDAETLS
jgi:prevent-host-death family protein